MSKRTVRADARPTPKPSKDPDETGVQFLKIVDELDRVRNLLQAASLIAQTDPDGDPIEAVMRAAEERLTQARNDLDGARPKAFWTGKPASGQEATNV